MAESLNSISGHGAQGLIGAGQTAQDHFGDVLNGCRFAYGRGNSER
jgi:hypothetical protein